MGASSSLPETPADATRWTRISERGSTWGMRFTVWLYRVGGRPLATALAHAIVAYFYLTDRKGRRASRAYLRRVFSTAEGRAALGRPPGAWTSFLHYRAFALSIVDRLGIWLGRTEDFDFDVRGIEIFDRLADEGRGAIVVGAHLGNFDAMRLLASRMRRNVNVLMYTRHAQRINTVFRELSPEAEARVIHADPSSIRSTFEIRACLERGEVVAMLGDRVEPGDRGRTSRVPFLGDPVELPQAPFLLAHLLDCPVILMVALRSGRGSYRVEAEELADHVSLPRRERDKELSELVTAYAGRLEHCCLRAPFEWFNFFDYWGEEPRGHGAGGGREEAAWPGES